jgi:putative membrane protein
MKYSGIGGQAVIEGIMMKNGDKYSTAVRKPDKTIEVMEDRYESMTTKMPLFKLPFIRGIFSFADSLVLGMKTLAYSASFVEDDEDSQPSKFEEILSKIFGDKLEKVIMAFSMFISILASVVIFMLLPMFFSNIIKARINNYYIIAIFEGVLRIVIFIAYIKLISRMKDINRTFMYHGAEHKCINCIEHGLELNVENVMKSSKEHKRCGTSFIIIVMMISILFFMVVRVDQIWLRALSRIVLVPVIAGISYEFLSLAGRSDFWLVNLLSKPGLMMQRLTTKEPTPDMVEVAIAAVEKVFDWRTYLKENF